jgi:hypothetical protein
VTPTPKLDVFARFTRSIRPGMRLVSSDDVLSVAAVGEGRLAAVVIASEGEADAMRDARASGLAPDRVPGPAEQIVRLELPPGSTLGTAEVAIATALPGTEPPARPPLTLRVEPDGAAIEFVLPAGAVASVIAEHTPPPTLPDDAATAGGRQGPPRFGASGTWWLEHEGGSRLGLSADGEGELRAGLEMVGVAPDDSALAQRWRAEACGDGNVRWVCEASGHQIDVRGASRRVGARVIQWHAGLAEHAPANSRFHFVDAGDGRIELVALHSGCALAIDAHGRAVQSRRGAAGTRWRLVRAGQAG